MARIVVDPGRLIGHLDRKVFGGFVEHLGRCIYGGIYDEGSALADARGFRVDVLALLRDLRVGVLRWPGGNFASNYHWADGIGPKDARPRRPNLAWGGEESNRFGTDEFLGYCAELGAEPYICLNMGTGSLPEALAWVEYCNGAGDTEWARWRRENGRDRPYRVRYWGLGNEMYGEWQAGALSAEEYVRTATRWARAIKMLDPEVTLVSCGRNGWDDWDRVVIDGLAPLAGLHSVHIYTGSDDYWTNLLQPHQAERAIRSARALIERAAYLQKITRPPRIACDEWNVWFRTDGAPLEERYTFADALAVATYLNIFVRNCDWVRMANLAQLVNAIAPVVTTPGTVAAQPIYYPVLLHAQAALDAAADVHVDGPAISPPGPGHSRWPHRVADLGPFRMVDAAATVSSQRGRLALTLVNRNPDQPETAEIVLTDHAFAGAAKIRALTAGRDRDARPLPGVEGVHLSEGSETPRAQTVTLTLPAESFTVLQAATTSRTLWRGSGPAGTRSAPGPAAWPPAASRSAARSAPACGSGWCAAATTGRPSPRALLAVPGCPAGRRGVRHREPLPPPAGPASRPPRRTGPAAAAAGLGQRGITVGHADLPVARRRCGDPHRTRQVLPTSRSSARVAVTNVRGQYSRPEITSTPGTAGCCGPEGDAVEYESAAAIVAWFTELAAA